MVTMAGHGANAHPFWYSLETYEPSGHSLISIVQAPCGGIATGPAGGAMLIGGACRSIRGVPEDSS